MATDDKTAVKPPFNKPFVRIGDCFSYIKNGANIKQDKNKNGIPITRIETLSNGRFNRDKLGYADIFSTKGYESRLLQDGDILMSHINSLPYLGRAVLYTQESTEQIIHGMNLLLLKANQSILYPQYAVLYFNSNPFKRKILNIAKKSVNQASFSISDLSNLPIIMPELSEQKHISSIFNTIQSAIDCSNEQLEEFDLLVKSRFVTTPHVHCRVDSHGLRECG